MLPGEQTLQISQQIRKLAQQSELVSPIDCVTYDNVCRRKAIIDEIVDLAQRSVQHRGGPLIHHRVLLDDRGDMLAFGKHELDRVDLGAVKVRLHLGERETNPLVVQISRPSPRSGDQSFLWDEVGDCCHDGRGFRTMTFRQ